MAKQSTYNKSNDINIYSVFSLVEIFSHISQHRGLQLFASQCEIVTKKPGQYIVKEGERGGSAFIVKEGEIEILRKNLSGDEDVIVARLTVDTQAKKLPLIGEQSLISHDGLRQATVRAITEVTLVHIKYENFKNLIKEFPYIGMHIYKEICIIIQERLSIANKNVAALFHAYKENLEQEDLLDN